MYKKGLEKEVRRLLDRRLSITASQALGVKQLQGYFKKLYSREEAKERLKKDTRRFAKRQLTWFRADKNIKWLDAEKIFKAATNFLKRHGFSLSPS